ncbi:N-formylglutamate amidohydrolase [Balamuthia mandrillaris]
MRRSSALVRRPESAVRFGAGARSSKDWLPGCSRTLATATQRQNLVEEAYEVLLPPSSSARSSLPYTMVLTCEHASMRLPSPYAWPQEDQRLVGTHWSYDPGSEDLTRELSAATGAAGVLSRFSRLLVDPNRPRDLSSPTLFRDIADSQPVLLNKGLSPEEKNSRLTRYYDPYHAALSQLVEQAQPRLLLSVHSFTPEYEGQKRSMEIGVLFTEDEELATCANQHLNDLSYKSVLNEPWSGKAGFMNSADQHCKAFNNTKAKKTCSALMLEIRQDLITRPEWRAKLCQDLSELLGSARFSRIVA